MSTGSHLGLAELPAEIRLHIFRYLLTYDKLLQRPSTHAADAHKIFHDPSPKALHPIQTSLLHLNHRLSAEALDVLYARNRFRVSYNHLCTCQARYPYTFDNTRIRELEIRNVYARDHGAQTCALCYSAGTGLITFLQTLPQLRTAVVAFNDMASFSDFARASPQPLSSRAIGSFTLSLENINNNNGAKTVHVLLPYLQRAWQMKGGQSSTFSGWEKRTEFKRSEEFNSLLLTLLSFLMWEARKKGRTATELRPFFVSTSDGFAALRVPAGERMAAFGVALAQTLADFFLVADIAEDVGWVEDLMVPVDDVGEARDRWTFVGDVDQKLVVVKDED